MKTEHEIECINKGIAEAIGWTNVFSDEYGPLRGVPPGDTMKMGQIFKDVPPYYQCLREQDLID